MNFYEKLILILNLNMNLGEKLFVLKKNFLLFDENNLILFQLILIFQYLNFLKDFFLNLILTIIIIKKLIEIFYTV